jgi:hypothetical protein
MISSREEAANILAPFVNKIGRCVLKANEEQMEAVQPSARAKTRKRTISGLMNDLVAHNLKSELEGLPGITIKEKYGQTQIIFTEGSSGLRMKAKQSNRRRPFSFIPTQLALDFIHQVEQLQLPEMPAPLTNVVLTYEWNRTRTEIKKMTIQCPQDELNFSWEIPITIGQLPKPVTPLDMLPDTKPTEEKRVVPKKTAKKAKKNPERGKGKNEGKGETPQS